MSSVARACLVDAGTPSLVLKQAKPLSLFSAFTAEWSCTSPLCKGVRRGALNGELSGLHWRWMVISVHALRKTHFGPACWLAHPKSSEHLFVLYFLSIL